MSSNSGTRPPVALAKPTVVLVPVWGVGHFVPMIEAGKRLVARSGGTLTITVLVIPAPTATRASEIAEHVRREEAAGVVDIQFQHLPAVPPHPAEANHTGIEEFISLYVQRYAAHVRSAVAGGFKRVAAVIFDNYCTTLFDAVHGLGVPIYVCLITSAAMCALVLRSPSLDEEVAAGVEFEELEDGVDVPGLPPVPPSSLLTAMEDRKSPTYKWLLHSGRRYMEARGILVNTVAELEPGVLAAIADGRCTRGVRAPTVYTIGPVLSLLTSSTSSTEYCVRWLDAQPPGSVVFLCFGGGGFSTAPQAHETARALERCGHRFLWVLRGPPEQGTKTPTDADLAELLPPGFLDRNRSGLVWPKRAPQKEILAHPAVGGFVTHCGWNSILESMWYGVPMVPWPATVEQHYNAFTLVAVMGTAVAMKVDRKRNNFVEAAELERAVRALMDGEEGKRVRDKAMGIKSASRRALEEDGGSSYTSLQRLCDALHRGAVLTCSRKYK